MYYLSKIITVWLFTTSWSPIKHTVFIVCASTPMYVYVPSCYFPSSFLKTSWLSGSCRTCRRPWHGAQPIQTLYMHKIHRWKFIMISKKCFPHVTIPPRSGADVGIPPSVIWSVGRIILLYQIKSTPSWAGTHSVHTGRFACVSEQKTI